MVDWVEPRAEDPTGGAALLSSQTHFPGSFFEVDRSVDVTYTFMDASGNEAECTFTVTVTRE